MWWLVGLQLGGFGCGPSRECVLCAVCFCLCVRLPSGGGRASGGGGCIRVGWDKIGAPTSKHARVGWDKIGDTGASVLAAILNKTMVTKLECAAAPECLLSCHRPLTLTACLSPLAVSVSTATRFRLTSSRAQSQQRRSTSRTSIWALPPPSLSRAASKDERCAQGAEVRRCPLVFASASAPIDTPPSLGSLPSVSQACCLPLTLFARDCLNK